MFNRVASSEHANEQNYVRTNQFRAFRGVYVHSIRSRAKVTHISNGTQLDSMVANVCWITRYVQYVAMDILMTFSL